MGTEEAWTVMDPNTSISSIEFAVRDYFDDLLSFVRVNYSDGETVLFKNLTPSGKAFPKYWYDTIEFDGSVKISTVEALNDNSGARHVKFLDSNDKIIS